LEGETSMTPQGPSINRSIREISASIGADIAYLEDDEMSHFDPISIVAALAALLLKSFFDGLREAAKDTGKKAGETLSKHLTNFFKAPDHHASESDVARSLKGVTDLQLKQYGDHAQALIVTALAGRGFPRTKAQSLANLVRREADLLLQQSSASAPKSQRDGAEN
jgi:hypothetical protein